MLSLIKEPLSERVNDDFWEIVEVTCRKKVGSGFELYVKSQKGRYANMCVTLSPTISYGICSKYQ